MGSQKRAGWLVAGVIALAAALDPGASGSDKQRVTQNCDQSDIGGQATAPSWQPLPAQ